MPARVKVKAGMKKASFWIGTPLVARKVVGTVKVGYRGVVLQRKIAVYPRKAGQEPVRIAQFQPDESIEVAGFGGMARITLNRPAPVDTAIAVTTVAGPAEPPASVIVPAGRQELVFTYPLGDVAAPTRTELAATLDGATAHAVFTTHPGISEIVANPAPGSTITPGTSVRVTIKTAVPATREFSLGVFGAGFLSDGQSQLKVGTTETWNTAEVRQGAAGTLKLTVAIDIDGRRRSAVFTYQV